MNHHDRMLAQNALLKHPEFSLRILWFRQVLYFVFLLVGIIVAVLLTVRAFSDVWQNAPFGSRFSPILFPVCWTILVCVMLRDGMARIRSLNEAIAQTQR